MSMWTIYCYGSGECDGPIHDWFEDQNEDVQVALINTLNVLKEQPDWNDSLLADLYFPNLQARGDDCEGFGEVMFSTPAWAESQTQMVEHRAIGQKIGQGKDFIILAIGTKPKVRSKFGIRIRTKSRFYKRNCPKAKCRLEQFEKDNEVLANECCFELPEQIF